MLKKQHIVFRLLLSFSTDRHENIVKHKDLKSSTCVAQSIKRYIKNKKNNKEQKWWSLNLKSPLFNFLLTVGLFISSVVISNLNSISIINSLAIALSIVLAYLSLIAIVYIKNNKDVIDIIYRKFDENFDDGLHYKTHKEHPCLVSKIYDLDYAEFGNSNVTDYKIFKQIESGNGIISALYQNDEIIAFFVLAFINIVGMKKVLNYDVLRLNDFSNSDFCNICSCRAIYICDIVNLPFAKTLKNSTHISSKLCHDLFDYACMASKLKYLFCRPVTDDGIRLASNYSFESIGARVEFPIYYLQSEHLPPYRSSINKEFIACLKKRKIL